MISSILFSYASIALAPCGEAWHAQIFLYRTVQCMMSSGSQNR